MITGHCSNGHHPKCPVPSGCTCGCHGDPAWEPPPVAAVAAHAPPALELEPEPEDTSSDRHGCPACPHRWSGPNWRYARGSHYANHPDHAPPDYQRRSPQAPRSDLGDEHGCTHPGCTRSWSGPNWRYARGQHYRNSPDHRPAGYEPTTHPERTR